MKKIYLFLTCYFVSFIAVVSQNLEGTAIYINPGHGGYDSDDRNIVIYPYTSGDPNGFWESQSNLDKGLQLYDMLERAGATVYISRTTNTTADDLNLSQIVRMANEADADFMLSIHSNAGVNNYILQLYAGVDPNDTHIYPTPTPYSDESRAICQIIADNLYSNQANTWYGPPTNRGDKTFGRTAMGWSDGYGVLRGLSVPGCISEGSMHDYIPETYRLMNMEYKWLEAWHFYKSFCEYFEAGPITTGNIVGTIHDSRNKNPGTYTKIKNSKDELLPLHGATVTVNPGNLKYTTDNLYNGVYVFKDLSPGTYQVTFEAEGYTPETKEMEVKANETSYYNAMLNKVRNTPPEVISFSPNVSLTEPVECSTPVVFEFNWDVDEESAIEAFSIEPEATGTITFEDSQHRMIFTPDLPYDTSQVYTVTLSTKLKHPAGLYMEEDFQMQFLTKNRNRLKIISHYPKEGDDGVHYDSPSFEFWFDGKINTATIRDAIKVYDSQGNEMTKNTRTVTNNKLKEPYGSNAFKLTKNLVAGESYTVKLDNGVIDVNGIGIIEPIEYVFKATDVRVTDQPVVETFETANIITFIAEESANVNSASYARNTSTKLFDTSSGLLKYVFSGDQGGIANYRFAEPKVVVNSTLAVGAHIYGDMTRNIVALEFKSEDNEFVYVDLATMDFKGWEFSEASLSSLEKEKEYVLSGIQVRQLDDELTSEGSIYLDNFLLYNDPSSSISTIPVTDIYVSQDGVGISVEWGETQISKLELYSSSGMLIRQEVGNYISSSDLPSGLYILKITSGKGIVSRSLVIK